MAKRWFVDVPPPNPDPNVAATQDWIQTGPAEGFKRRKDAVEYAARVYGAVGGKVSLISSGDTNES
jgi:hypothetical protein